MCESVSLLGWTRVRSAAALDPADDRPAQQLPDELCAHAVSAKQDPRTEFWARHFGWRVPKARCQKRRCSNMHGGVCMRVFSNVRARSSCLIPARCYPARAPGAILSALVSSSGRRRRKKSTCRHFCPARPTHCELLARWLALRTAAGHSSAPFLRSLAGMLSSCCAVLSW